MSSIAKNKIKSNFETQTEHTFEEKILCLRNVNKEKKKMLAGYGHSYDGKRERGREGEWEIEKKYQDIQIN